MATKAASTVTFTPSTSFSDNPLLSATRTSFPNVPLTTVFTSPASCSTRHFTILGYSFVDRFYGDRTAYWDYAVDDAATLSCYPSRFAEAWTQERLAISSSTAIFSPGICPSHYTTVNTSLYNAAEETFATCCLL